MKIPSSFCSINIQHLHSVFGSHLAVFPDGHHMHVTFCPMGLVVQGREQTSQITEQRCTQVPRRWSAKDGPWVWPYLRPAGERPTEGAHEPSRGRRRGRAGKPEPTGSVAQAAASPLEQHCRTSAQPQPQRLHPGSDRPFQSRAPADAKLPLHG